MSREGDLSWDELMVALGESVLRYRQNFGAPEPVPRDADVFRERLLEEIYPHGGVEHEQEWLRLTHADLATMSLPQLAGERARLRLRLMLDPSTDDLWLTDRAAEVEAEIIRRD